jgi:hypothetical protein
MCGASSTFTAEARRRGETTMRTLLVLCALSSLCAAQGAVAPKDPPKVLLQVMHCAAVDKFGLLPTGGKTDAKLRVAWAHRVRTDPYVDEFFIVLEKSPTEGDILVYSREYAKGKVEFYLGNNATFVIHAGNLELIDPLWGMWTRANITRNVKKALRSQTYSIPVRTVRGSFPNVACHSYDE